MANKVERIGYFYIATDYFARQKNLFKVGITKNPSRRFASRTTNPTYDPIYLLRTKWYITLEKLVLNEYKENIWKPEVMNDAYVFTKRQNASEWINIDEHELKKFVTEKVVELEQLERLR